MTENSRSAAVYTPVGSDGRPMRGTWRRVADDVENGGSPGVFRWNQAAVGDELAGVWRGPQPGKYGPVGLLQRPDGHVQRFQLPAMLGKRLVQIPEGQPVRIIFLGERPLASGDGHYFAFDVFTFVVPATDDVDGVAAEDAPF